MLSRMVSRASILVSMLLAGSLCAESATMSLQSAQEALRTKGYMTGPADGKYGPQTREALTRYQKEQGLPTTGQLDTATMDRLSSGATAEATGSVKGAMKEATSATSATKSEATSATKSTDNAGGNATVAGSKATVKDAGSSSKKEVKSAWKEMKNAVGKK